MLTAHPRAYERTSDDLSKDVPAGIAVERAFALDTSRHLSFAGRYPAFLARPDRWMTWRFGGSRAGVRLIRERSVDVIWSTYPIATAHVIGPHSSAARGCRGSPILGSDGPGRISRGSAHIATVQSHRGRNASACAIQRIHHAGRCADVS